MPSIKISKNDLDINIVDLLLKVKLISSKSEGKRLIEQNGISVNQEKVKDINAIITEEDFKEGHIIIQKGKKVFLRVEIN